MSGWRSRITAFIANPLIEAERERREFLASPEGARNDLRTITILTSVAVLLTLQHYLLSGDAFVSFGLWTRSVFPELAANLFSATNIGLSFHLYWALGQVLLYVAIPVIQILFFFRQPLTDYGLKVRGFAKLWGLYLAMLSVMVPIVFIVSRTDNFQAAYPFYRGALDEPLWPRFWIWEAAYFLQFVGLEFFFRGYLLHGVKRRFGAYAIFVMMVPYCMIHFGKPMPETFAAIAAGIILGFMSLRTRSIWMGAALHVSVALTMDFCSLWRLGRFD
ncbi:MAG: CPBP family intramembrane metalloprotease [Opitutales bacterium]|nr:CPBP family intramembrane metalloprotease [Opitutales bacterium]